MTLFIWDASHYDGYLDRATLERAKAEGIVGLHHKMAEGLGDTEHGPSGEYDDTALGAARNLGYEFLGAYVVPRTSPDSQAQVDFWIAEADSGEPWWREFAGWYWVVDLELWSYDKVQASKGVDVAKRLRDKTSVPTLLYASHGQYGDQLTSWDGPLINADYVSRTAAGFAAMYPGDGWTPLHSNSWRGGWYPYSGKPPAMLQYTSQATIAGRTTCDINAFRGTLDQLRALLQRGGSTMLDRCKLGDAGLPVTDLQNALVALGGNLSDVGGVDGQYGKGTARELAKFTGDDGTVFGVAQLLKLLDVGSAAGGGIATLVPHTHTFDPVAAQSGPAVQA